MAQARPSQPSRPTTPPPRQPAPPPKPAKAPAILVELVAPTAPDDSPVPQANVPGKWGGESVERAGAFNPTPKWTTPGEYIDGTYIGMDAERGPNKSRLYHLRFEDGTYVDVWGSTALDQRMDDAFMKGLTQGDDVYLQYLGTQKTARGMNPVKVFDVRFLKAPAEDA